ncbi:hypothetical protein UT300005_14750 [Clostridium sp. CTA-5]
MELKQAIRIREDLFNEEKKLYINSINILNTKHKELIDVNYGSKLVNNIARDISGEAIRRFFDLSDLYITADQLAERILKFDYNNEYDPLKDQQAIIKNVYNYSDSKEFSSSINEINKVNNLNTVKVYQDERSGTESFYDGDKKYNTRSDYKNSELVSDDNKVRDSLTGKMVDGSSVHGDHVRAMNSATYNSKYMDESYVEEIDKIYNSPKNMQWIDGRANQSKSDIPTYEGTIERWENATGELKEHLQEKGYLDKNGDVPSDVKKNLKKNFNSIENTESLKAIKHAKYNEISKEAFKDTKKGLGKIFAGQMLYYALPPLVYEIRILLKDKFITLQNFLSKIKESSKRIINYIKTNLKDIMVALGVNSLKKFLKVFFDILLSLVKGAVEKVMKLAKSLVLALVDSAKILLNKDATKVQKAEAIFNLISITISNVVVQEILEYAKAIPLPSWLWEVIEILAIVFTTNIVMLILEKMDLFNTKYGLLVANIEKAFEETKESYLASFSSLNENANDKIDEILNGVEEEISIVKFRLKNLDMYNDNVQEDLEGINKIFDMNIDFDSEWNEFIGVL